MKRFNTLITITWSGLLGLLLLGIPSNIAAAPAKTTAISAQLKVVLDDDACQQLLVQIGGLQGSLEQMLCKELDHRKKTTLYKNLMLYLFKNCGGLELLKHSNAQDPIIKVGIALCDAMSLFIEELLCNAQATSEQVALLKQKALESCMELKRTIQAAQSMTTQAGGASSTSIDQCYTLIVTDLKTVLMLHPALSLGTFNLSVNDLNQTLNPYTERFLWLFKQALMQNLTQNDVDQLIKLVQSPVYTKIKNHLPGILQVCLDTLSPETKQETEGVLSEFWNQTQSHVINSLQRLKQSLSKAT